MIVKYYKGYISMNDLELRLNTNKFGTNAYQIVNTLDDLGFKAEGIKITPSTLNEIVLPCIAHVVIDKKYNHYVVIYKLDLKNKKIIVADPSSSLKKINYEDFLEIWDGILITVYPVKPISICKEIKLFDFVKKQLLYNKKELIYITLLSVVFMIFTVVASLNLKFFLELINEPKNFLTLIFIYFIIIEIFKITSSYLRTNLLILLNQKIDIDMNMEIYNKVINLPYQYYRNRTTGEIISKILDLDKIRNFISNLVLVSLFDLPLTVISGLTLFFICKNLFYLSCIILLFYVLIYLLSNKKLYKKANDILNKKADFSSFLFESINSFETVKGLNLENKMVSIYDVKYSKYLRKLVNLDKFVNIQSLFKDFVESIGQLFVFYFGICFIANGIISLSDFIAFNSVSTFFFSPMRNIININLYIEQAKSAYKKAYELIVEDEKKGHNIVDFKQITIKNLNYAYSNGKPILKNINLNIKKGEKVLITGKSGAGKSTIFKLFMKYYKPMNGEIKINDIDINELGDTRSYISYVSQNELLFTESVYNNINLCEKDIDSVTEVMNICKIDEIIKDNNLGYNMVIEENGFNISGGQRQRIVLARALLNEFEILLVDEGLNQVDVSLERNILKSVFEKYSDKTMIFVSHRLENLDLYDRLIEIENGHIIKDKVRCMN